MSVVNETSLSQDSVRGAGHIYNNTQKNGGEIQNLDKQNGNTDISRNVGNTSTNNGVQNSSSKSEIDTNPNSKSITSSSNFQNVDLTSSNSDRMNGNSRRPNQTIKSNFSRSNPQLYGTSLEIHPLSNSLMDGLPHNGSLTSSCNVSSTSRLNRANVRDNSRLSASNRNINSEQSTVRVASVVNTADVAKKSIQQHIPIIGYEVMEERARFTIYKLRIDDPRTGLSWMVFRRYTDFVRLYQKLRNERANISLPLPEKRLFRNNFDPIFLDDRMRGLQVFVNAIMKTLSADRIVREFFCLDEPPPVGDSEPEAQAMFGAMEDTVGALKNQIRQQEETMRYLRQKVFYLEEKMKNCNVCNPLGHKDVNTGSPGSSASSNTS